MIRLLIAWLALQVAFGNHDNSADNSGAFRQLASNGFGRVVLWLVVVGMVGLVGWQLAEAFSGSLRADIDGRDAKKLARRASHLGRAIVYVALGISAAKTALGHSQSSASKEHQATGGVLGLPGGRVLVVIAGLVVLAIAVSLIVTGVRRKFTERDREQSEYHGASRTATIALGTAGYPAKGAAFVVIGLLVIVAGFTADPDKSGGLDGALKTLAGSGFGKVLLVLIALGIACFGAYCLLWSRAPKVATGSEDGHRA